MPGPKQRRHERRLEKRQAARSAEKRANSYEMALRQIKTVALVGIKLDLRSASTQPALRRIVESVDEALDD